MTPAPTRAVLYLLLPFSRWMLAKISTPFCACGCWHTVKYDLMSLSPTQPKANMAEGDKPYSFSVSLIQRADGSDDAPGLSVIQETG